MTEEEEEIEFTFTTKEEHLIKLLRDVFQFKDSCTIDLDDDLGDILDVLLQFKDYIQESLFTPDRLDVLTLKSKDCTKIKCEHKAIGLNLDFDLKRTIEEYVAKAILRIIEQFGYTKELQIPEEMKEALEKINILSVAEIDRRLAKFGLIQIKNDLNE